MKQYINNNNNNKKQNKKISSSKTLNRSTSFYKYEDYISHKSYPGPTNKQKSNLNKRDNNNNNNNYNKDKREELTRYRLKERYEEMKLNTLKINKSRQIMLHNQTSVSRTNHSRQHIINTNNKKTKHRSHHVAGNKKHYSAMEKKNQDDAQILLETIYKHLNKNYFSISTWFNNLKKVKGLYNHNFNPNWVENILSPILNINSKQYDIDTFLVLLSLQNTPPKQITITMFLNRLYNRLEKFALEAVDTKYFLND